MWDWSFDVPFDLEKPSTGLDDPQSRLQGATATRAADGVRRYLGLAGATPADPTID